MGMYYFFVNFEPKSFGTEAFDKNPAVNLLHLVQ